MQIRTAGGEHDTSHRLPVDPACVRISVAGRLTVALDQRLGATARAELDPCPAADPHARVDIEILRGLAHFGDGAEIAGDGGDGWLSAGGGALQLARGARGSCVATGSLGELPVRIVSDGKLPTWTLMRTLVRPLLQVSLPARGGAAVHAAAVSRGGTGVLVTGWSESGKTELALAMAERGWRLLADKWTVVGGDGRLAPFPVRAGIRRWALDYLPHLRSALPARTRWRLDASAAAGRIVARGARRAGSPPTAAALELAARACAQGERLSLPLSELHAAYDGGAPEPADPSVGLVVMLRTIAAGAPRARPLAAPEAIRRMTASAAFERRESLGLLLRRRYAGGEDDLAGILRREREIVGEALAQVPVIELSCPFPCDPRSVADVVEAAL